MITLVGACRHSYGWVFFCGFHLCVLAFGCLEAQTVKNLPAMLETQVQSLGWEDPL